MKSCSRSSPRDRLFYAGTNAAGGSVVGVVDLMNGTNAESSFQEALTELVALRE